MAIEPLLRRTFDTRDLVLDFPPAWRNRHKIAVWGLTGRGAPHEGTLTCARWASRPLPGAVPPPRPFRVEPGLFDYPPEPDGDTFSWHLNFADPWLFVAYEGPLLAQDELQVLEHPALGSLREALSAQEGEDPATVARDGTPTPVTLTGVQRRCVFETRPTPAHPRGLYGNAFAAADPAGIRDAVDLLDPPTLTNLLAMAAPQGGWGPYEPEEIEDIVITAFSGFAAAVQEGERAAGRPVRTLCHTGHWGCGAFGGDRTLMAIAQMLAADLAGADLVFHAVDAAGARTVEEARRTYLSIRQERHRSPEVLAAIHGLGRLWGESDGN